MFDYERHLVVAAVLGVAVLGAAVYFIVDHADEEHPAKLMPQSGAPEKTTYTAPSLEGFVLTSEENADGDGDGVNETHIKRYRSGGGDGIFSMTTGRVLWAWSYDTHADGDSDIDRNYVIRDSDCDGVFDQRYSLAAEFRVPDCTKGKAPVTRP